MASFSVLVFEGGSVPSKEDSFTMDDWTVGEARRVFGEYMGDASGWMDEEVEWSDPPLTIGETVQLIGNNLATASKCGVEGGQLYIVRM